MNGRETILVACGSLRTRGEARRREEAETMRGDRIEWAERGAGMIGQGGRNENS